MKILYEILVPTIYGDTMKPIRTAHHKEWDKYIQSITGGLTILSSARGKWTHEGVEYPEKVIPVRVMVEEEAPYIHHWLESMGDGEHEDREKIIYDRSQINKIVQFTLSHYRQKAVMYYLISNQVNIVFASNA